MDRWLIFVKERFPLLTFCAVSAGIAASGVLIGSKVFIWGSFILSFLGILGFFAVLRLMDEVKDFDKDKIAHPQRPLPRGLVSKSEAIKIVDMLLMVLFAYSFFIWLAVNEHAALAYLFVTGYLWMMYKEFGLGSWLSARPFLYGLTHQLVVFPIAIFAVSVARTDALTYPLTWSFGLMLLGAFFTYEICRKLDPHTHPVLATYIHFHGFRRTYEVAFLMVAFSAMGAVALGVWPLLLPCEFILLGSLSTLFFQPTLFKIPEMLASLSLMIHVWAVALFRAF